MTIRTGDGSGSGGEQYRTCTECGAGCPPEPFETDGYRIAFLCPQHGVHSMVDPFDGKR